MNTVNIGGQRIRFVIFNRDQQLFRANATPFVVNRSASENYVGAPMKYFTLSEREIASYISRGKPFKKTWRATEDLKLIDILHKPTREALARLIGSEDLDHSFPIIKNKVYRVSEENEAYRDDNVLREICELGNFDGYYMRTLERNNASKGFHSEVGICGSSLKKLRLENIARNVTQAPPPPTRKRRRPDNNNNNMRRNNNNGKRPRFNFTRRFTHPSLNNSD